ncbi:MAG: IS110 family transposase [Lachnospirales bacterium]
MYFLGIDIAKTNHVASLIDINGETIISTIKFTNDTNGYQKLLLAIKDYSNDKDNLYIAMEATGIYWLSLFSNLKEDEFNVSAFNPFQIKTFRSAVTNRKQKTDSIDSVIIAQYIRTFGANENVSLDEKYGSLKRLTRHRSDIINNVSATKTRLIGILDVVFPEYSSVFSDIFCKSSLAILEKASSPKEIAKLQDRTLLSIISTNSKGRLGIETVQKLKELAKNSFGSKVLGKATTFEVKQLLQQLVFFDSLLKELDEEIDSYYNEFNCHLTSIPGIGKTLAPIILAEIGDISNFSKPNKLVAFAGSDPSVNQSGNKSSANEKISKRGSPYLRHAIYTASFVAISNDETLRAYYDKKKSEGKHHYVALNAISRKLLTIIWCVLSENRPYYN